MRQDLENLSLEQLVELRPEFEADQRKAEDDERAAEQLPDENGFTEADLYRLSASDFSKVNTNPEVWRPVRLPNDKIIVVRRTNPTAKFVQSADGKIRVVERT